MKSEESIHQLHPPGHGDDAEKEEATQKKGDHASDRKQNGRSYPNRDPL